MCKMKALIGIEMPGISDILVTKTYPHIYTELKCNFTKSTGIQLQIEKPETAGDKQPTSYHRNRLTNVYLGLCEACQKTWVCLKLSNPTKEHVSTFSTSVAITSIEGNEALCAAAFKDQ